MSGQHLPLVLRNSDTWIGWLESATRSTLELKSYHPASPLMTVSRILVSSPRRVTSAPRLPSKFSGQTIIRGALGRRYPHPGPSTRRRFPQHPLRANVQYDRELVFEEPLCVRPLRGLSNSASDVAVVDDKSTKFGRKSRLSLNPG